MKTKKHKTIEDNGIIANGINKKELSEAKRKESLKQMIKGYQEQKSTIKAALSNVDFVPKNRIVFDNEDTTETTNSAVNNGDSYLFGNDNDDDNTHEDINDLGFDGKTEIDIEKTRKLREFQKKVHNDERFKDLGEDFFEETEAPRGNTESQMEDEFEEEKNKQYEILGQVLGTVIKPRNKQETNKKVKGMVVYDPLQPDHEKYEIKTKNKPDDGEVVTKKKKRKEASEIELPVVSKETTYSVNTDCLDFQLEEKQEFRFGFSTEVAEKEKLSKKPYVEKVNEPGRKSKERNPFRYDSSSDEEEETEAKDETEKTPSDVHTNKVASGSGQLILFSEPFFFKEDDFRLQEGFDFMQSVEAEDNSEFSKLRRDLKKIVKAKVKNNQRKNKLFKKKLGGSKRKKMIKMKKALRR